MIAAVVLLATAPAGAVPIARAMTDSARGWNTGDLDRFMAVYATDAVYVTARGLVRGKAAIAARYRPSFRHGGNARGTLSFRMLDERRIDATHRVLFARWTLAGGAEASSGMTTLVWERRRTGWRIVADHSS